MTDTNMTATESPAQTENVSVDDAKQAILRSLRNGDKFTQLSLIEGVVTHSGVDVARVFDAALVALMQEGAAHSAKGRNGGVKLGPKASPTSKSVAAAIIAARGKAQ